MIFRHIDSIGELSIEKAASSIGIVGRQGAHPLSSGFRGEGLGGKGLGWGGVMRVHSLHIQPIQVYICCLRLSVHYRLQQPASMYMCERPVGHSPGFRDDHFCVPALPDPICMFLDTGHYLAPRWI